MSPMQMHGLRLRPVRRRSPNVWSVGDVLRFRLPAPLDDEGEVQLTSVAGAEMIARPTAAQLRKGLPRGVPGTGLFVQPWQIERVPYFPNEPRPQMDANTRQILLDGLTWAFEVLDRVDRGDKRATLSQVGWGREVFCDSRADPGRRFITRVRPMVAARLKAAQMTKMFVRMAEEEERKREAEERRLIEAETAQMEREAGLA